MKILLLGADGQLGYELHRTCAPLGDILPYTFSGKLAGRQGCGQIDFAQEGALEALVLRHLYRRSELEQVLFTIGLTFFLIAATNALAGWFTAKSGRTFTFAAFANDVPDGVIATRIMDAALLKIAESQ